MRFSFFDSRVRQGFTLVEVMVALSVLTIGILSLVIAVGRGVFATFDSRDVATATLLAQEGVELVYNIRDTNILQRKNAFESIDGLTGDNVVFGQVHSSNQGEVLSLSGDRFVSSGGTSTKFRRKIDTKKSSDGETLVVDSFVSWSGESSFPPIAKCAPSNECVVVSVRLSRWLE
ncbi:MAG: prepilin-type N-terminal cleavage/methylation domain-containing protein [Candidatus Moranbacteria bacterium]|nr:prepilin-type N-terminal cleavage/methylation domain-containing protein [Candidatus Moranbacteria bacterium]